MDTARTASYITEAIQHAIAQGAIAEAYQADHQEVIAALNQLRATEVTSYLQYKQHAYMAVSLLRRHDCKACCLVPRPARPHQE